MYVIDQKSKLAIQVEIIDFNSGQLETLDRNKFEFDWSLELKNSIVALQRIDSNELLGLMSFMLFPEELRLEIKTIELAKNNVGKGKSYNRIAGILISYACKISFQLGYFGFVSLVPKTRLIGHYKEKYKFKQYGRQLAIDLDRSEQLIEKYLLKK